MGSFASGELQVLIEMNTVPENAADYAASCYDFTNFVGGIIQDVMNASYASGSLLITSINVQGVGRSHLTEVDQAGNKQDYFQCRLTVNWGLQS